MMTTTEERQKIKAHTELVKQHRETLKALNTHTELRQWAKDHGIDGALYFHCFKKDLKVLCGIDYESLRAESPQPEADVNAVLNLDPLTTPTAHLWAAAVVDGQDGAFAIVAADDSIPWYGSFSDKDMLFEPGDEESAENSAADKAVWLTSQAMKDQGYDHAILHLHTTFPDLDEAALIAKGAKFGILVKVEHDPDDLRAANAAELPGYSSWKDAAFDEFFAE